MATGQYLRRPEPGDETDDYDDPTPRASRWKAVELMIVGILLGGFGFGGVNELAIGAETGGDKVLLIAVWLSTALGFILLAIGIIAKGVQIGMEAVDR